MHPIDFAGAHAALRALSGLAEEDGFTLDEVEEDEAVFSCRHAGWLTRFRAVVFGDEPECSCGDCLECDDGPSDVVLLEVEMQHGGLDHCLRGSLRAYPL